MEEIREKRLSEDEMLEAINAIRIEQGERPIDFERSEMTSSIEYIEGENDEYIIEQAEMIGGYEGAGEDMECTLKITRKEDKVTSYLTFYGYHDSWSDSYFHTIKCTEPKEKVIIVYTEIE